MGPISEIVHNALGRWPSILCLPAPLIRVWNCSIDTSTEPFVPSGVRYRGLQQTAEAAPEQEVEDFSLEWWRLMSASLAFHDR